MASVVGRSDTAANQDPNTEPKTEKPWKVFLIIHHPRNANVLLITSTACPELPCFFTDRGPRPYFFENTAEWIPEVQRYFGFTFDLTLLRCISNSGEIEPYRDPEKLCAVVVFESHGEAVEVPSGSEWTDASCISLPDGASDDVSDAVERFVEECRTGIEPSFRPLFARRGWYESAVDWMRHQLVAKGFGGMGEVTQIKCTYRGTVLKAKTNKGVVYLKCSPFFTNEASTCEQLAILIPKFVAAPIASDVEMRLLLMRDCGEMHSHRTP